MIAQTHFRSVALTAEGPVFHDGQLFELPRQQDFLAVRPIVVGVCSSDVKEVSGVRPHRHDFGHEIVGTVADTSLKDSLQPGDRVIYDPHVKLARNSGFSELVIAAANPEMLTGAFFKVAPELNADKLVFLEPLACIIHAYGNLWRQSPETRARLSKRAEGGGKPGERHPLSIGIFGAGNAGTVAALYGKHLGLAVTLINRSGGRLAFLEKAGMLAPEEMTLAADIKKDKFDIVLLATSFLLPEVVAAGLNSVKDEGVIILYGGTTQRTMIADIDVDDIRRNEKQARLRWNGKEAQLVGTHGALRDDFRQAYSAVRSHPGNFPFERLITHRIGLEDLPALLREMSRNPDHCIGKAVVDFPA